MNILVHAIIDLWVSPFILLAYMSPLRNASMASLRSRIDAERNNDRVILPHRFEYEYSELYRKKAVKYGTLAVAGEYIYYFHQVAT